VQTVSLADQKCVPCRGNVAPLKGQEIQKLLGQLEGWTVIGEHHLAKRFIFPDFKQGLDFVNRTGAIAEEEGHHPDIFLAWGKVEITIFTHKADGLTDSDFVLAAKIDRVL
jgi:4a-hydroxytetrahydrobiopterin dehydratase